MRALFSQYPLYAPALVNRYIGPNQSVISNFRFQISISIP